MPHGQCWLIYNPKCTWFTFGDASSEGKQNLIMSCVQKHSLLSSSLRVNCTLLSMSHKLLPDQLSIHHSKSLFPILTWHSLHSLSELMVLLVFLIFQMLLYASTPCPRFILYPPIPSSTLTETFYPVILSLFSIGTRSLLRKLAWFKLWEVPISVDNPLKVSTWYVQQALKKVNKLPFPTLIIILSNYLNHI